MGMIDVSSKYASVVTLKDKKGITNISPFRSIFNNLDRKPNKIWLDHGSEFYCLLNI